ncbi:DUF1876 domain-containing protein [Catenulispora subtropica]
MEHAEDWNVAIHLFEERGRTIARAVLTGGNAEIHGRGEAHLSPYDHDVPRIGDELAVGRALADLGKKLVRATEADIGEIEGHPVHLAR